MNTKKDIYTVIEAATLFNKSPNLIYKELKKHKLNSIVNNYKVNISRLACNSGLGANINNAIKWKKFLSGDLT